MSAEQNKSIVLQMYQTFDQGNLEQAQEFLAPNFVAYIPGTPEPLNREAFIQSVLMVFNSAFPDGHHTFADAIAETEKVVTRGTFTGTHSGELLGIPPTGKQITMPFFHIDRVVDGKIVEHWGQSDLLGLMQQMGVVLLPGPDLIKRKLYFAIASITSKFQKKLS